MQITACIAVAIADFESTSCHGGGQNKKLHRDQIPVPISTGFNNYIYALDRLDDYNEGENIVSDIRITEKGFEYIKLRESA